MILLTGASGFIGKHLLKALVKKYGPSEITAFTSAPISEARYLLHNNYNFDENYFVESGVADTITTILHAGAFTPKNSSQANDWRQCNDNIFNTHKLLNSNLPNLQKFIYLSTLDVYGADNIISEKSPVQPVSLYGYSKLYGEKMISAWANSENKVEQILRVGHVYGPGEELYQKIIPVTMKKLAANQPVRIWGTGKELRSFIFIKDIVQAILKSIELPSSISPVNLVSSHSISIFDMANRLIAISGENVSAEMIATDTVGRNLVFDNGKMRQHLLSTETALDEGLRIEWDYMKQLSR